MHDIITTPRVGQCVGVCGFRGGFAYVTVTAVEPQTNHLGAAYSTLTVELDGGEVTTVDSRFHVFITEEYERTAWCPECRRTRDVEEESDESHMTAAGEVGYRVTRLSCGHTDQGPGSVVAPAPGAPYAGPQAAVAASHRPRDLQAARQRQRELDARGQSIWADQ